MLFRSTHVALRASDPAAVITHCQRWCELEAGKARDKVDCDGFCRQVIPLMPDKGAEACKVWVDRVTRQGGMSPADAKDALPECLMMLAPSPKTCIESYGPSQVRACRDRHAVLEALRLKDPKLCPKSLLHGPVCAALTSATDKEREGACLKAARSFTEPFCKERRQAGGLQDETKLPGDSESELGW